MLDFRIIAYGKFNIAIKMVERMKKILIFMAVMALTYGSAQNAQAQAVTTEMAEDAGVEAVYYDDETGLTDEDIKYMKACREMMAKELETLDPEARMIRMEEIREKYHNKTGLIDWKAEYEQMTADME